MTDEERALALAEIIDHYGFKAQVCKLIEELGEATSAASELLMLEEFNEDGGKRSDRQQRVERLLCEMADVQNVMDQLVFYLTYKNYPELWNSYRDIGIAKTIARIDREKQKENK